MMESARTEFSLSIDWGAHHRVNFASGLVFVPCIKNYTQEDSSHQQDTFCGRMFCINWATFFFSSLLEIFFPHAELT